ncbi:hypothetical protein [Nostocoides veronense]|uniref:Uncharacterized protein n=1 Tax=Nostocoides veronense TaxID=330836 RepID=A0ABN2LJ10_9MICO
MGGTSGGPYWNFERELARAAESAVPNQPHGDILRTDIAIYPKRTGLHVAIQQGAAYASALGTVEFDIPWDRLIAPKADMSFIPNQWGH